MAELLNSPLHSRHVELGAKLGDFNGWLMPIEYPTGVMAEHAAVREQVGIFDVSHLGKALVRGRGAADFVNATLTNDLGRIGAGRAQYTLCCDEATGGVVDDLIAYLRSPEEVLLVPNAANTAAVVSRLAAAAPVGVAVTDEHTTYAVIAVQGPRSAEVLSAIGLSTAMADLGYMHFVDASWQGRPVVVCRSGYTGERGFELLPLWADAVRLWDAVTAAGADAAGGPCGLGARDTLRTEMGYPLHGHELSLSISPVAARVAWAVGWDKSEWWGREALVAEREAARAGQGRVAWGLIATGRGIPRADSAVRSLDGRDVGVTTSGTFSPTLKQGIALAMLDRDIAAGDELVVDVRGRELPVQVVRPPFVAVKPDAFS